jgi:hypothetical protein
MMALSADTHPVSPYGKSFVRPAQITPKPVRAPAVKKRPYRCSAECKYHCKVRFPSLDRTGSGAPKIRMYNPDNRPAAKKTTAQNFTSKGENFFKANMKFVPYLLDPG